MRYDALVIGAGMSGLAAGIRLAQFDRRVAVLERHYVWGGLNSFYKLGGRLFDTGLHALTNYVPPGTRGVPLTKILRQLRIRHEELRLAPQRFSEIVFPGLRLRFSNEFGLFEEEVAAAFPRQRDGFRSLVQAVRDYELSAERPAAEADASARTRLADYLSDPLLVDALLLPLCYYGSAREGDVDWQQFVILFRSIFLEGLARPEGGIREVLRLLVRRYRALGGELRMRSGVRRLLLEDGAVRGVELDGGEELLADRVLSSAGHAESLRLAGRELPRAQVGRLSFMETISVLDREPATLGYGPAVAFFNLDDRFRYRVPAELADPRSGVISAPGNYASEEPLKEGMLRVTLLADHAGWTGLDESDYRRAKGEWSDRALASVAAVGPDVRPHETFRDVFTPRTIERFTGHLHGAVYGSPLKRRDGVTAVPGLYLCGTDQGYLGVIGALLSGISMANQHVLAPTASVPSPPGARLAESR